MRLWNASFANFYKEMKWKEVCYISGTGREFENLKNRDILDSKGKLLNNTYKKIWKDI